MSDLDGVASTAEPRGDVGAADGPADGPVTELADEPVDDDGRRCHHRRIGLASCAGSVPDADGPGPVERGASTAGLGEPPWRATCSRALGVAGLRRTEEGSGAGAVAPAVPRAGRLDGSEEDVAGVPGLPGLPGVPATRPPAEGPAAALFCAALSGRLGVPGLLERRATTGTGPDAAGTAAVLAPEDGRMVAGSLNPVARARPGRRPCPLPRTAVSSSGIAASAIPCDVASARRRNTGERRTVAPTGVPPQTVWPTTGADVVAVAEVVVEAPVVAAAAVAGEALDTPSVVARCRPSAGPAAPVGPTPPLLEGDVLDEVGTGTAGAEAEVESAGADGPADVAGSEESARRRPTSVGPGAGAGTDADRVVGTGAVGRCATCWAARSAAACRITMLEPAHI
ncbi:hypothetical protein [Nocardioides flavescens]|uniref:Uncharacterized protein n=1 Tax=Nocardioides flavescens TaxID=2691959 RepID=A0A6L7EQD2_9ACTN|nr:hypothetical protein [Nocardioides flavescens]MXG88810.1 hypothetical protein [Nocardioides flavescens]